MPYAGLGAMQNASVRLLIEQPRGAVSTPLGTCRTRDSARCHALARLLAVVNESKNSDLLHEHGVTHGHITSDRRHETIARKMGMCVVAAL